MDTKTVLQQKGLKATPVRIAVLEMFSGHCQPMNVEGVCKKIKVKDLNLVTAYRTLNSFEKAGLVKRVDLHRDSVYYERIDHHHHHHHHHVVCTDCGLVESLSGCTAGSLLKSALKQSSKFSLIKDHSLEFFGLCKKCG